MSFHFSREGLEGREKVLQRFLEAVPGAASWGVLLGMIGLSLWKPKAAAVGVIAFFLYWLLRLFYEMIFLVLSYSRLSAESKTDWMERLRLLGGSWRDIVHVVIFPIAREAREIFEPGVRALLDQTFPSKQILLVLAVEERAAPEVQKSARDLADEVRGRFLDALCVIHPDGLPGEARVKGANATWAAQDAARFLERRGIPFQNVIASCFDADTVVDPQYMACVAHAFVTAPDRARASFQPIPVYHNNIWEVPGFARVMDVGSSFFQLCEATHPEKLVTFSSHSMSFQALAEVGYWPVDMISDDSAIFWKAFLKYEGDYSVHPVYVTVSMDVAAARSWRGSVANIYKQKRRWAWGVENFPIVMRGFLHSRRISLAKKIRHGFKLFEGHLAWATWPFLIGVIGWLPAWLAGREFSDAVVFYTAPRIMITVFQLASVGLVTSIVLSLLLLPKPPTRHPWWKRACHAVEWLLLPMTAIVLSAAPALDAQTRLMLGKRLEFWVAEKRAAS